MPLRPLSRQQSRTSHLLWTVVGKWQDTVYESKLQKRQVSAAQEESKRGEAMMKSLQQFMQRISELDPTSAAFKEKMRTKSQRRRDNVRRMREKSNREIPLLIKKWRGGNTEPEENEEPRGGSLKVDVEMATRAETDPSDCRQRPRARSDITHLSSPRGAALFAKRNRLGAPVLNSAVHGSFGDDDIDSPDCNHPAQMGRFYSTPDGCRTAPTTPGDEPKTVPVQRVSFSAVEEAVLTNTVQRMESSPRARRLSSPSGSPWGSPSSSPRRSGRSLRVPPAAGSPHHVALASSHAEPCNQVSSESVTGLPALRRSQNAPHHFTASPTISERPSLGVLEEGDEDSVTPVIPKSPSFTSNSSVSVVVQAPSVDDGDVGKDEHIESAV